ncbi:MAG: hypothetical protein ACOC4M_07080 [Promethearchaeia archaeon]
MGNKRLDEFYDKIHDSKNKIPEYLSISVRPGKKILDFKIKKMASKVLKIIAHEKDKQGWFTHSFHVPIKNIGLSEDAKNKHILPYLNNPRKIRGDQGTREILEEILRKYVEILPKRKKHYFRTKRFKKKKDYSAGTKIKGF